MKLTKDGLAVEMTYEEFLSHLDKFKEAGFRMVRNGPSGSGLYSPTMDRLLGESGANNRWFVNPSILWAIGLSPDEIQAALETE